MEKNEFEKMKQEMRENMRRHQGMPDPDEIKKILDIVAEKIPGFLKELSNLLYGPESTKKYATAAASFYKELKDAGMSEEQAFDLTQQYMSTLNLGHMINRLSSDKNDWHRHHM